MTESQQSYWFKPKRFGYGATPTNWKGWAVSFAYLLAIIVLFFAFPAPNAQIASGMGFALWLCAVAHAAVRLALACEDEGRVAVALGRARVRSSGGIGARQREFSGVVECSRSRTCT